MMCRYKVASVVGDGRADTLTARRKRRRAAFRELVALTPRGISLGFARDKARKALRAERKNA